ncbi:hypothetical protein EDC04DRAFT_1725460 [Pisolithus marmoratus]|nr:hypothetical protein EDC04DRAFT_1725460 [Pisolithus marmoratus]
MRDEVIDGLCFASRHGILFTSRSGTSIFLQQPPELTLIMEDGKRLSEISSASQVPYGMHAPWEPSWLDLDPTENVCGTPHPREKRFTLKENAFTRVSCRMNGRDDQQWHGFVHFVLREIRALAEARSNHRNSLAASCVVGYHYWPSCARVPYIVLPTNCA